jgi:uncharacterized radical SAM superfamily Fe-S cluster-containing enzyme
MFIDRFNNDQIYVSPCCQAIGALEPAAEFNFYTSTTLSNLRNQFDAGNFPTECDRCWQAEKHGHKSRRQSAIEFFNLPVEDRTVTFEGLDHNVTWACNLACIMCNPVCSSTWAKEEKISRIELNKIGRLFLKSNDILNQIDVTLLKKLHFNGGEPLLNNDHVKLLQKLQNNNVLKNVFVSYNTNGTVLPDNTLIDLWSQARLVKIFFSIDAVGDAFDYIRWPAKWKEVEKNILYLKETLPSNVMFGINTTVGSYNIFEIRHVIEWFNQHLYTNREGDNSDFAYQLADNYNMQELNDLAKQAAIEYLSPLKELQGIVLYLKSNLNSIVSNEWIIKLDKLDKKRGNSWRDSLHIAQYY